MGLHVNTKQIIADALLELLESKKLEEITVGDIANQYEGSRQTFYRNFHDKYELANWIYAQKIEPFMHSYGDGMSWFDCMKGIHEVIYEYRTWYAKVEHIPDFTGYVFDVSVEFIKDAIAARGEKLDHIQTLDEVIAFYCIGARGVTQRWVATGMKASPAYVAQVYVDSLPSCLSFLAD